MRTTQKFIIKFNLCVVVKMWRYEFKRKNIEDDEWKKIALIRRIDLCVCVCAMQFVCDSMLESFSIVVCDGDGNGNGDDGAVNIVIAAVIVVVRGDVTVAKQTISH